MKKTTLLAVASVLAVGVATPSFANDALNNVASFFGSTAATIVDVPEGIVVDSLWRMPLKTTQTLADKFGDSKGFQQNVVGAVIGIPVGFLWGIPEGAIRGGHHGMSQGWEKPFSTDSFIVTESEK